MGAATSIIFVATKHVFCRDESMLVATKLMLVAAPANDSGVHVLEVFRLCRVVSRVHWLHQGSLTEKDPQLAHTSGDRKSGVHPLCVLIS